MISKEMYEFLREIPRHPQTIPYEELNRRFKKDIFEIACEAEYKNCEYINGFGIFSNNNDSKVSLTEKGQAAIEEYEQSMRNQKIIEKSLNVSQTAMWAAIASAVVAIASLIKLFV